MLAAASSSAEAQGSALPVLSTAQLSRLQCLQRHRLAVFSYNQGVNGGHPAIVRVKMPPVFCFVSGKIFRSPESRLLHRTGKFS